MKKILLISISILISILIVLFAISYNNSKFTTENWISNPSLRYKMIETLEENYHLQGKTYQEIIDILGEPDEKWEHNFDVGHRVYFKYYIGKEHYFFEMMWEPDMYLITFRDGFVLGTSVQPI